MQCQAFRRRCAAASAGGEQFAHVRYCSLPDRLGTVALDAERVRRLALHPFVWLWRLGCGLYRCHPAVREVRFLLVAGMLFCWGFRGFSPITWYKLDVSCCSGGDAPHLACIAPATGVYVGKR